MVYLDRIFILAEPATQVEGCSEDSVQEAKKIRIRVRLWNDVLTTGAYLHCCESLTCFFFVVLTIGNGSEAVRK